MSARYEEPIEPQHWGRSGSGRGPGRGDAYDADDAYANSRSWLQEDSWQEEDSYHYDDGGDPYYDGYEYRDSDSDSSDYQDQEYPNEDYQDQDYVDDDYGNTSDYESSDDGEPYEAPRAHRTSRRRRWDGGSFSLIVLLILAVAASVLMLLTSSDVALRIALIAALWAALIGFYLVVRYRKQAEAASSQLTYEQDLYESQLVSAERRYQDLQEETQRERESYRKNAAASAAQPAAPVPPSGPTSATLSDEDRATLREIRESLHDLRERLEDLQGRPFDYEPAALRAEAIRVQELEARAPSRESEPEKTGHVSGAPSVDAVAGNLGEETRGRDWRSTLAPELRDLLDAPAQPKREAGSDRAGDAEYAPRPSARPQNDSSQQSQQPVGHRTEEDEPRGTSAQYRGTPAQNYPAFTQPAAPASPTPPRAFSEQSAVDRPTFAGREGSEFGSASSSSSFQPRSFAAGWPKLEAEDSASETSGQQSRPSHRVSWGMQEEERDASRGRRRADENNSGVSVAELMANMQKKHRR